MLIKCRYCAREFEKPSHRDLHERYVHRAPKKLNSGERMIRGVLHVAMPKRDVSGNFVIENGKKVYEWVPRVTQKEGKQP